MARQVLTYPDIPPVLTQAAADTRYSLVAHNHDAAYATVAHLHTGVYQPTGSYSLTSHNHDAAYSATTHLHDSNYLKLSGGNLTGPLTFGGDVTLSRTGAGAFQLGGTSFSLLAGAGQHANVNIDSPAEFYKVVALKEEGSLRWQLGSPGDAATGDFYLWRYPAGVAPLRVSRANGTLTLNPDAGYPATVNGPGNSTWQSDYRTHQLGMGGALYAHIGYPQVGLIANIYYPVGGGNKYVAAGYGASLLLGQDGSLYFDNAINGAAGGTANMVRRLHLNALGTLEVNTDENQPSIRITSGNKPIVTTGAHLYVGNTASYTLLQGNSVIIDTIGGGLVYPNRADAILLGMTSAKWAQVWCTQGAFNGSHVSFKEAFAPLDPVSCAQAVLETEWYEYDYVAPPDPPEPKASPDETEGERAARVEVAGLMAKEAAAKRQSLEVGSHQRGYVLGSDTHKTHPLFGLSDRVHASPSSDLAVVACALQHCLLEIAELKARLA